MQRCQGCFEPYIFSLCDIYDFTMTDDSPACVVTYGNNSLWADVWRTSVGRYQQHHSRFQSGDQRNEGDRNRTLSSCLLPSTLLSFPFLSSPRLLPPYLPLLLLSSPLYLPLLSSPLLQRVPWFCSFCSPQMMQFLLHKAFRCFRKTLFMWHFKHSIA